ncbi:MAG: ADP-forming succinate--CoA ligase subunit beta [Pseudomonadota bacterium]|nr:ADP-forming succinate--CoA ligase subunit beta [Pseudomonadota bacterium]
MNFEEHAAKPLLKAVGIAVPEGQLATTADAAATAATKLGPCVVKAQVPTGKRGKAGGIKLAGSPEEARKVASAILGMEIAGHKVVRVLVEQQVPIARELYAAILNDSASKGPLLLFSAEGGMDIEELAEKHPDKLLRVNIDIRKGLDESALRKKLPAVDGATPDRIAAFLVALYKAYIDNDAELLEVNPLVLTKDGRLIALDCKFTLDDSGIKRHAELARQGSPERLTVLEKKGQDIGFKYIELDGDVGLLSNGAGLTMTTMDAIAHYGGKPANFLEIGGNAYVLGRQALEVVLGNPRVKSLLINFCGAIARTDVMTDGVLQAWDSVKPKVPVFWAISGTGEDEAKAMLKKKLGVTPYPTMDDAVKAAVEAAR